MQHIEMETIRVSSPRAADAATSTPHAVEEAPMTTTVTEDDSTTSRSNTETVTVVSLPCAEDETRTISSAGHDLMTAARYEEDELTFPVPCQDDTLALRHADDEMTMLTEDEMKSRARAERNTRPPVQLNINSVEELHEFLRAILLDFLRVVDPHESGFMDELFAAEQLTETDMESLSGKDVYTRQIQARKLWFHLNNRSVADFKQNVVPKLCSEYSHIIPLRFVEMVDQCQFHERFDDSDGQDSCVSRSVDEEETAVKQVVVQDVAGSSTGCLRHAIEGRIRVTSVADTLYHCGCLRSLEDYRKVTNSGRTMWTKLFSACHNQPDDVAQRLQEGFVNLLMRYRLGVPSDLSDILSRGLPCTCARSKNAPEPSAEKVQTWLGSPNGAVHDAESVFGSTVASALEPASSGSEAARPEVYQSVSSEEATAAALGANQAGVYVNQLTDEDDNADDPFEDGAKGGLAQMPTDSEDDGTVRLLLVGKTGNGKSSTANTILGEKLFRASCLPSSVTKTCQLERRWLDGRYVEIMDTPGLFDTGTPPHEIVEKILQALACTVPGPHAILYVIVGSRFTAEEWAAFQGLKAYLSDDVVDHMIVAFTRGDELEEEGIPIEEFVKAAPSHLKQILDECGQRYVLFNNKSKDRQQVQNLFSILEKFGGSYYKHFFSGTIMDWQEEDASMTETTTISEMFSGLFPEWMIGGTNTELKEKEKQSAENANKKLQTATAETNKKSEHLQTERKVYEADGQEILMPCTENEETELKHREKEELHAKTVKRDTKASVRSAKVKEKKAGAKVQTFKKLSTENVKHETKVKTQESKSIRAEKGSKVKTQEIDKSRAENMKKAVELKAQDTKSPPAEYAEKDTESRAPKIESLCVESAKKIAEIIALEIGKLRSISAEKDTEVKAQETERLRTENEKTDVRTRGQKSQRPCAEDTKTKEEKVGTTQSEFEKLLAAVVEMQKDLEEKSRKEIEVQALEINKLHSELAKKKADREIEALKVEIEMRKDAESEARADIKKKKTKAKSLALERSRAENANKEAKAKALEIEKLRAKTARKEADAKALEIERLRAENAKKEAEAKAREIERLREENRRKELEIKAQEIQRLRLENAKQEAEAKAKEIERLRAENAKILAEARNREMEKLCAEKAQKEMEAKDREIEKLKAEVEGKKELDAIVQKVERLLAKNANAKGTTDRASEPRRPQGGTDGTADRADQQRRSRERASMKWNRKQKYASTPALLLSLLRHFLAELLNDLIQSLREKKSQS